MSLLKPFQQEGADWLSSHHQALLADDMGLGKTRQLVVAADNLISGQKLVVGTASARVAWQVELKILGITDFQIINHQTDKLTNAEWIITSYAIFRARRDLQTLKVVCVIVDECQAIKNMNTQTSEKIIPPIMRSEVRWFASGTPIKNHYGEFYNYARMIIPMKELAAKDLNSYAKWKRAFCIEVEQEIWTKGRIKRVVRSIQGSCNPGELKQVMGPYMLRRRKRDVLKDFPDLAWQALPVQISDSYNYTEEEIEQAVQQAQLGIAPAKGHNMALHQALAIAKVAPLVKIVQEHFDQTEAPLVIFSFFLEPIEILIANLKKLKITCAGFTGATSPENRFKLVNSFQAKEIQVLVGQTISAGVAITLTAAWRCLFLNLCWTPADNAQARDRLWRMGQELDVLAQYLVVENNPLDNRVQEVLARKTRDLEQLDR